MREKEKVEFETQRNTAKLIINQHIGKSLIEKEESRQCAKIREVYRGRRQTSKAPRQTWPHQTKPNRATTYRQPSFEFLVCDTIRLHVGHFDCVRLPLLLLPSPLRCRCHRRHHPYHAVAIDAAGATQLVTRIIHIPPARAHRHYRLNATPFYHCLGCPYLLSIHLLLRAENNRRKLSRKKKQVLCTHTTYVNAKQNKAKQYRIQLDESKRKI